MHFSTSTIIALASIVPSAFSHCVLTSIQGANGVTMPGLSVIDGTPRDCATPGCGAEADTSIIRQGGNPLGKTNGAGAVDAETAVAKFMGTTANKNKRFVPNPKGGVQARALGDGLSSLFGGGKGGAASGGADATGVKTPKGTVEDGVASSEGTGAESGLPTVGADGVISMTLHQVNQDGAGPMTAAIDPTSGGTDEAAFQPAQMIADVPGAIAGRSGTTTTDFPIKVQMPAGMTCSGTVAGQSGVCVVRVKNSALAGPFGGSAVFTQDSGAASASAAGNTTAQAA